MPRGKGRAFHGDPCKRCGATLRYVTNRNCVACRHRIASEKATKSLTICKPKRGRDWPTVTTKAGDKIPMDPIATRILGTAGSR